jgi:integrase
MLDYLGISGVHTHSLRHQFASEALDANPRGLANISQVLGHDSIETTLHFYINSQELHQTGEKPQVARSARCLAVFPGVCAKVA